MLVCKGCETTWHRACGKGWDGTGPNSRTDERVEVLEMPKVPKGQIVIKVEGEEGDSGGEEERVAEKANRGGTWMTCGVGECLYRTKNGPSELKKHKAAIHAIDIVWQDCPELGCEYKAKQKGRINVHRADVHDIGVTLY